MVDRLLACKEGHVNASASLDEALERVFYRRAGPIASAVAITNDAGDSARRTD